MTTKDWRLPAEACADATALQRELGCLPITAQILWQRGYRDPETARIFLSPAEQPLDVGTPLTDLDAAAARLHEARARSEGVLVFGDYDVDGVSATALMVRGLRRFGIENLDWFVPERETDGYGISADHVRNAVDNGAQLIVTVDNGIAAHEAARAASELGIDLVITDHHHIEGSVPGAVACVNPKRDGEAHPLYNVSGSTVAWLLSRALTEDADPELGYVALGTVADVMPMTGVNRTFVMRGLRELAGGAVLGITALAGKAKLDLRQLRAEHIAFQLGPRLNAAGRLGNARAALDLLLTTEAADAARLSRQLDEANARRRTLEREVFHDAVARLDREWQDELRTIVLGSEGWSKGIIGIVAAKIAEKYERPTALLSYDADGMAYASARSRPGFDLMEALAACNGRLTKYGGHRAAAGFTLARADVDAFIEEFECAAGSCWAPEPEDDTVDAILAFSEIDAQLLYEIATMEPFGPGNPEPLFCTCDVWIPSESVRVYNGGHLGLRVEHHGRQFGAIAFNQGELASGLQRSPGPYDVLYRPKFNTFRNQTSIQLQIEGIRPATG